LARSFAPGWATSSQAGRREIVDEHLAAVLAGVHPLTELDLTLLDAQGCVLSEDIVAEMALRRSTTRPSMGTPFALPTLPVQRRHDR